jgi:hypothetical protein
MPADACDERQFEKKDLTPLPMLSWVVAYFWRSRWDHVAYGKGSNHVHIADGPFLTMPSLSQSGFGIGIGRLAKAWIGGWHQKTHVRAGCLPICRVGRSGQATHTGLGQVAVLGRGGGCVHCIVLTGMHNTGAKYPAAYSSPLASHGNSVLPANGDSTSRSRRDAPGPVPMLSPLVASWVGDCLLPVTCLTMRRAAADPLDGRLTGCWRLCS